MNDEDSAESSGVGANKKVARQSWDEAIVQIEAKRSVRPKAAASSYLGPSQSPLDDFQVYGCHLAVTARLGVEGDPLVLIELA